MTETKNSSKNHPNLVQRRNKLQIINKSEVIYIDFEEMPTKL